MIGEGGEEDLYVQKIAQATNNFSLLRFTMCTALPLRLTTLTKLARRLHLEHCDNMCRVIKLAANVQVTYKERIELVPPTFTQIYRTWVFLQYGLDGGFWILPILWVSLYVLQLSLCTITKYDLQLADRWVGDPRWDTNLCSLTLGSHRWYWRRSSTFFSVWSLSFSNLTFKLWRLCPAVYWW